MGVLLAFVIVAVAVAAFLTGSSLNKQVPAPLKPFGLEAFEAQGLQKASADVVKAVVATISFLGHPFTVVQEATEAKGVEREYEANCGKAIAQNLKQIADLQKANKSLELNAKVANARAAELDNLVVAVNAVVGAK